MKTSGAFPVLLASAGLGNAATTYLRADNFATFGDTGPFDYVIVGGGTAGLVVAMRLAENGSNTVAVIEAGGFYDQDNGRKLAVNCD